VHLLEEFENKSTAVVLLNLTCIKYRPLLHYLNATKTTERKFVLLSISCAIYLCKVPGHA